MAELPIRLHLEDPDFLRASISFTAAETRFAPRLIEKDYFCSVVLEDLIDGNGDLTFKGGTCLAKVHSGFHRLSEDLDFSIHMPIKATRRDRSQAIGPLRARLNSLHERIPGLRSALALTGSNASRQYNATLEYRSLLDAEPNTIRIEVGLREPILDEVVYGDARTLALHPGTGGALIDPVQVRCLSSREAMAEKLRAALSRREIAIRDFFDLDAAARSGLDLTDDVLIGLLRRKLAVPGNEPEDLSDARLASLLTQLEAELRPVLRSSDFEQFDLDRAIELVREVRRRLA